MKLSIMFITHNRKKELLRAIESCLINCIEDMEIIIVDNNSSDGTEEVIRKFLEEQKIKYTYFFSKTNLGVSGGRNKAFSLCKGEYIFGFDDDAIIKTEGVLKKSCEYMDQNENIGAIAYNIYEPDTNNRLIGCLEKKKNYQQAGDVLSFVGAAHMLRRKIFDEKLYPEKLFFGAEELYASHVIVKEGYKIKYMPEMIIYHLPSSINRTRGKERDYNFILNQYIVRLLTYPRICRGGLSILFILRLVKNNLCSLNYLKQVKRDLKIRYSKEEIQTIRYKDLITLIKKFGIKDIF